MQKSENLKFDFMLKEYEMLYSKFEMHYSAVEKSVAVFLLIVGAILSTSSLTIKDFESFDFFKISQFHLIGCLIMSILGFIITLKVIEHRLLVITYVKSLNLNRKWFQDNFDQVELSKYSLFKAGFDSPKYYKKFRHFYWEILGLATIVSIFCSLFTINILKKIGCTSKYYEAINWTAFVILTLIVTILIMGIYKQRGEHEEKRLTELDLSN